MENDLSRSRSPLARRNRGTARGRGARGRRGRARVNHARGRDANQPTINWSSIYQAPEPPAFNEPHPGPTSRFQDVQEKDYFEHLFNNEMWEIIVSETNRYYEQQKASDPDHHKTEWHPVTKGEVHAFVGMLILMGIVRPARFQMYWESDQLIHQESIANIMPRTRFFQIWRYFHLEDNSKAAAPGTVGHDKIYRIWNFLTIISRNVEREYRLSRDISIDETMVPHKGRLSFKQYIKNKPKRWGIKLWVLCQADTGYVYRFQVYFGKQEGNPETNLARRVVRDLTVTEHDRNHHLYMDNFYNDPYLFKELLGKNIFACGIVRPNHKGFPDETVITKQRQRNMTRGEYLWRSDGQLVAIGWLDKRPVYLLSTIHPPSTDVPTTILRREGRGERQPLPCPPAQVDYQKFMGVVNLADQMLKSFSVVRKSRKAWKKLFAYGLEVCLLNSFIIMRKAKPACKQEFLRFRVNIAQQLIAGQSFRARIGRRISQPLSEVDALRLNGQFHPLEFTDSRLDCVVCAKVVQAQGLHRYERSKSGVKCTVCNVALCVNKQRSCWNMWHTRVEYWLNA